MYALICTTPRLMNTGTKFRDDRAHVLASAMSSAKRRSGATRSTTGICTANCSALPTTEPQASSTASRGSVVAPPNTTSVAIIAAFHMTGAAYDSRKR